MSRRIAILIADGFADSGLSIALDVFRAANAIVELRDKPPPFELVVASATGGRVRAASGLVIESTRAVARLRADVWLLPGFWMKRSEALDALLAREDVRRLARALRSAHARGAIVGSACAGSFVLAEAGLLDGREATTTWWLADEFARRYPKVKLVRDAALVVGRRLLTGGAVFAQADVAMHLVGRLAGPAVARTCADALLLDTHASQAPYMAAQHLRASDPVVAKAERWVRHHLSEPFSMAQLAQHAGVSQRTLARRLQAAVGLGPMAFVQRMRTDEAVLLLQTSPLSLEEISARVGYAEASTLSRLIRRETRTSAQEIRRRGRSPRSGAGA